MDRLGNGIIMLLILLYIVSPVDACPGPIDDLIILLVALMGRE